MGHAAGDGVCIYAGEDIKTYGKLVVIRHANGYVTAYADNSELEVKEGDTIKRGQVIARAGASGEVKSLTKAPDKNTGSPGNRPQIPA